MPAVVTRYDEEPAAALDTLRGHVSALVGHPGDGKSTLVNRMVPDADLATGEVSAVGKAGTHLWAPSPCCYPAVHG